MYRVGVINSLKLVLSDFKTTLKIKQRYILMNPSRKDLYVFLKIINADKKRQTEFNERK